MLRPASYTFPILYWRYTFSTILLQRAQLSVIGLPLLGLFGASIGTFGFAWGSVQPQKFIFKKLIYPKYACKGRAITALIP